MQLERLALLRLAQLADSAVPIGALVHSFGLETLVADDALTVAMLPGFLRDYLQEVGALEAHFCRAAWRLPQSGAADDFAAWLDLNRRVAALKLARENRAASAMLGKRFLRLACDLEALPLLLQAQATAHAASVDTHHSAAFGLVGGALGLDEEGTVLLLLQQSLIGLVSVCQRLLPLGQSQASRLIWQLKPALIAAAQNIPVDDGADEAVCFTPLLESGSMRHPALHTRLFVS